MDLELYDKIRCTPCKIHKILSIKESFNYYQIENDYILTIKSNTLLDYFISYSQFREEFLKIFRNIDCYKINRIISNSFLVDKIVNTVEVSDFMEEDFDDLKQENTKFLILSGIVLVDEEKSIIDFSSLIKMVPDVHNNSEISRFTPKVKKTTIESYNNLYELSLDEDVKIENIEIL
jgi:hypothetical protein